MSQGCDKINMAFAMIEIGRDFYTSDEQRAESRKLESKELNLETRFQKYNFFT